MTKPFVRGRRSSPAAARESGAAAQRRRQADASARRKRAGGFQCEKAVVRAGETGVRGAARRRSAPSNFSWPSFSATWSLLALRRGEARTRGTSGVDGGGGETWRRLAGLHTPGRRHGPARTCFPRCSGCPRGTGPARLPACSPSALRDRDGGELRAAAKRGAAPSLPGRLCR